MSTPESPANFCYRHPDRQSFVLCQRCARTVCGECQTPGAVGVICPECMHRQKATAPKTKSTNRWMPRRAGASTPVVTYALIAVSVLLFVVQQLPLGATAQLQYAGVYSMPGTQYGFEPWRMLTSVFLHGGIFHLLLNMYSLWIFGQMMENFLGRGRFLALYLISGFAGSVGVLLLASPTTPVVGASGAIFGLMGAFVVIQRKLGGTATQLYVLLGINLVIGFVPGFNIAWQAHLGGLIGGALVGLILVSTRRRTQSTMQTWLLIGLSALLIAVSLIHYLV